MSVVVLIPKNRRILCAAKQFSKFFLQNSYRHCTNYNKYFHSFKIFVDLSTKLLWVLKPAFIVRCVMSIYISLVLDGIQWPRDRKIRFSAFANKLLIYSNNSFVCTPWGIFETPATPRFKATRRQRPSNFYSRPFFTGFDFTMVKLFIVKFVLGKIIIIVIWDSDFVDNQ